MIANHDRTLPKKRDLQTRTETTFLESEQQLDQETDDDITSVSHRTANRAGSPNNGHGHTLLPSMTNALV